MIDKEQVMDMLLNACPSYNKRYEKYVKENYTTDEDKLIYLDISDFLEHVIECYQNKQTNEFDKVFEAIEELHINGNSFVKELATIGGLETLQNKLEHKNVEYGEFEKYLRSESKIWWNNLIDFWNGKTEYVGGPIKEQ
ncbi:hypothetical protein [Paenibacillus sp. MER 99-2]|uniref:DUF7674 family protein n=1 Tax=Paenibacillus sp. MER 99-2 TaxID=2939572 RepID=UPI002041676A|nr:hypothetical protein [Paenibacillus sp. MER 99-2]MCM3175437.1 hypothetical protein [Paenibacillus sp. MER 99-2]